VKVLLPMLDASAAQNATTAVSMNSPGCDVGCMQAVHIALWPTPAAIAAQKACTAVSIDCDVSCMSDVHMVL
jgi:hypothetical protein